MDGGITIEGSGRLTKEAVEAIHKAKIGSKLILSVAVNTPTKKPIEIDAIISLDR
ncbi:MAG: hypothetical protein IJU19_04540 [Bacteroidales bacterium]|nr:hypothetical protein [Bacteroidales bacterium]